MCYIQIFTCPFDILRTIEQNEHRKIVNGIMHTILRMRYIRLLLTETHTHSLTHRESVRQWKCEPISKCQKICAWCAKPPHPYPRSPKNLSYSLCEFRNPCNFHFKMMYKSIYFTHFSLHGQRVHRLSEIKRRRKVKRYENRLK